MRKILLALLASAALLLGACSDDGGDTVEALDTEAALSAVRDAPDAAADAGSGRMEMRMEIAAQGQSLEITAEGVFSGTQAQITMNLGEQLAAAFPGEELPPGFDEPMTVVVDGTTTYMRMPMLTALTGTDGWFSISAEDMGLSDELLSTGAPTNNPAQMLETLRGVSDEIEDLGDDEVRGTAVRGYRVVVDLEKAAGQVPAEMREAFQQQMESLPVDDLPMDVWLDSDGLPRRIEMDLTEALASTGESGTVTMDYFDYGAEVSVDIPDPSEVTPFSEVMGSLGG